MNENRCKQALDYLTIDQIQGYADSLRYSIELAKSMLLNMPDQTAKETIALSEWLNDTGKELLTVEGTLKELKKEYIANYGDQKVKFPDFMIDYGVKKESSKTPARKSTPKKENTKDLSLSKADKK